MYPWWSQGPRSAVRCSQFQACSQFSPQCSFHHIPQPQKQGWMRSLEFHSYPLDSDHRPDFPWENEFLMGSPCMLQQICSVKASKRLFHFGVFLPLSDNQERLQDVLLSRKLDLIVSTRVCLGWHPFPRPARYRLLCCLQIPVAAVGSHIHANPQLPAAPPSKEVLFKQNFPQERTDYC